MAPLSNAGVDDLREAPSAKASTDGSSHEHAGHAVERRFRRAPPSASATTGRPQACASTGTMPKSSSPGISTARRPLVEVANLARRSASPVNSTSALAARGHAPQARLFRSLADDRQRRADPGGTRGSRRPAACREPALKRRGRTARDAGRAQGGKRLYRQEDTRRSTHDYSIGGFSPQHNENSPHSGRTRSAVSRSQRASRASTGLSRRDRSRPTCAGPK